MLSPGRAGRNPAISKIYVLNRTRLPKLSSLKEPQEKALLERGVQAESILDLDKVKLLEGDLAAPAFGLPKDLFEKMKCSVTHIIHNAWPVNFNLSLASFESNIKGLRNLIDFALTSRLLSPPSLAFTSSIGVFQNVKSIYASPLPEAPIVPEVAVGTGYTESKWVSEEILIQASKCSKVNSIIVRVGQLTGGLNGAWNTTEWLPALVQSGQVCRCLPADEQTVDWILPPIASKSLVDFRLVGGPASSAIIHLVYPRPVPWSSLAKVMAADLSVPLVPFSEWLEKLEQSRKKINYNDVEVEDLLHLQALRLLQFFRSMSTKVSDSENAFGFPRLACEMAIRSSSMLSSQHLPQLGEKDAKKWVQYWRNVAFIQG